MEAIEPQLAQDETPPCQPDQDPNLAEAALQQDLRPARVGSYAFQILGQDVVDEVAAKRRRALEQHNRQPRVIAARQRSRRDLFGK